MHQKKVRGCSKKWLWLAVTADEYETPLAIGETSEELAELIGVDIKKIRNYVNQQRNGKRAGMKFVRVKNEDITD